MRRLLKVKEFCHLKKRDAETSFDSNNSRSSKYLKIQLPVTVGDCWHRRCKKLPGDWLIVVLTLSLVCLQWSSHSFTSLPNAAKRPRVAAKCHKTSSSSSCSEQDSIVHVLARAEGNSIARGGQYERFIKLFENERTRDIVWWLPGRKGEAFAMKKELFEHELLKSHFQLATFAEFEKQLTLWYVSRKNICMKSHVGVWFHISWKSLSHLVCSLPFVHLMVYCCLFAC